MNTQPDPLNSALWGRHQARAAAQLPGDFADRVLRANRLATKSQATNPSFLSLIFRNPFTLSAITACCCLLAAVVFYNQTTIAANEQNLAEWRELAQQTASLDPL